MKATARLARQARSRDDARSSRHGCATIGTPDAGERDDVSATSRIGRPAPAQARNGAGIARLDASRVPIERVAVLALVVPTDTPESDGTLEWRQTTMVLVLAEAGGAVGIGYGYANVSTARFCDEMLAPAILGRDALDVGGAWVAMQRLVRNMGRSGVAAMAISAMDASLWDLKARLLGVSVLSLLGAVRDAIPAYGSGGFTSYDERRLCEQLGTWVADGLPAVKMKVGRNPAQDRARVAAARQAIGPGAQLFVDANGAHTPAEALAQAEAFAASGVTWFEEPVTSDDLPGLRLLRERLPAGMVVAAGEYGYDTGCFRRMLDAGAVDVLQADATRCMGVTGFLQVAALCDAYMVPLSAHTAPSLHAHLCCAASRAINVEYFHDHARMEQRIFDGAAIPRDGALHPDRSRPGLGLELVADAAEEFLAWSSVGADWRQMTGGSR